MPTSFVLFLIKITLSWFFFFFYGYPVLACIIFICIKVKIILLSPSPGPPFFFLCVWWFDLISCFVVTHPVCFIVCWYENAVIFLWIVNFFFYSNKYQLISARDVLENSKQLSQVQKKLLFFFTLSQISFSCSVCVCWRNC